MRFFIDAEFWERGPAYPIQLISLAIHSDRETDLYLVNQDFEWQWCESDWLHQNVKPNIDAVPGLYVGYHEMAKIVEDWIRREAAGQKIEFWGDYCSYDWVVFCQMFGSMVQLPSGFPMFCMDVRQFSAMLGNPEISKQEEGEHNALMDARWTRTAWHFLVAHAMSDLAG